MLFTKIESTKGKIAYGVLLLSVLLTEAYAINPNYMDLDTALVWLLLGVIFIWIICFFDAFILMMITFLLLEIISMVGVLYIAFPWIITQKPLTIVSLAVIFWDLWETIKGAKTTRQKVVAFTERLIQFVWVILSILFALIARATLDLKPYNALSISILISMIGVPSLLWYKGPLKKVWQPIKKWAEVNSPTKKE